MATLEQHFSSYSEYHQTKGNKLTHYAGIPMIMFSTLGFLALVQITGALNLGVILWAAAAVYYVTLDWKRGLPFAGVTFLMYWGSLYVGWVPHLILFVGGWILQGIGHYVYEKKSPAFLTNVTHLLIGPFWIFCGLTTRKK